MLRCLLLCYVEERNLFKEVNLIYIFQGFLLFSGQVVLDHLKCCCVQASWTLPVTLQKQEFVSVYFIVAVSTRVSFGRRAGRQ